MTHLQVVVFAAIFVSGPISARDRLVDGFPDLPQDARAVAERSVACQHFEGEISGSGDERDREVAEALSQLKCDQVARDLEQIQKHYAKDPAVLGILSEAAHE